MTNLKIGDQAPDFTLMDQIGNPVNLLSSCKLQPVLLIIYPGDDTPGCTKQLCAIRNDWSVFLQLGVAVYGINPGTSESHQRFMAKYNLTAPLLVDTGGQVAKQYQAWKKLFKVELIERTVVLVDTHGIIRYLKRGLPPNSEIIAAIKSL
jgi:peroxiredoxin Q/BCP